MITCQNLTIPARLFQYRPSTLKICHRNIHPREAKKEFRQTNIILALENFDGLYSKIYGKQWPSMRLGLLSVKKKAAVLNSFVDNDDYHQMLVEETGAIPLKRYYDKHLRAYVRYKLREEIISNKKARKMELMARDHGVDVDSVDPDTVEVSDVSDSELRGAQTTDRSDGFSSAEDLQEMFSDRRMDDDDKFFINRASTQLSLQDFVQPTEMICYDDVTDEVKYYEGFKEDLDLSIEQRDEPHLDMCNQLKVYCYPRGDFTEFPVPKTVPKADLYSHYLLDGASILPVLALDLQTGDYCADYCAAPGGKSLAMLMTLKPGLLVCNDSSKSRLSRLTRVFNQYTPDINYLQSTLRVSKNDARHLVSPDAYDKILVDVPCLNDRNSVEAIDNNIFKRSRINERLSLPTIQSEILKSALKSLRPNGSVVYSTCTLSPIENDGVIQKALLQLKEEDYPHKFVVMNLKEAFRPFRGLYKFDTRFRYGQQVVPNICSNFGPMFISKIKRIG